MAVLSFSGKIHMDTKLKSFIITKKYITKSLQVPCSPLYIISKSYLPGKRVLPFISQNVRNQWLDAGITVEAAVVLPLFLLFFLAVLAPMQWLNNQRKIQTIIEMECEDLSQYAYLYIGGNPSKNEEEMRFSDAAAALWLYGSILPYSETVRVVKSEVPNENQEIHLELLYREEIPFIFDIAEGVSMKAAAKRRCWNGLGGKLKRTDESGVGVQNEREMVYVTLEGERYHRYRECQYLSNVCRAVSAKECKQLRNRDGKIFYACEHCMHGADGQDTVYITEWGTRYHSSRSCAATSLCFRKVPLDEVVHMGECSVCARRRMEDAEY